MFCTSCGKKIDDDAMFCPECGASLSDESPRMTSGSPAAYTSSGRNPYAVSGGALPVRKKAALKGSGIQAFRKLLAIFLIISSFLVFFFGTIVSIRLKDRDLKDGIDRLEDILDLSTDELESELHMDRSEARRIKEGLENAENALEILDKGGISIRKIDQGLHAVSQLAEWADDMDDELTGFDYRVQEFCEFADDYASWLKMLRGGFLLMIILSVLLAVLSVWRVLCDRGILMVIYMVTNILYALTLIIGVGIVSGIRDVREAVTISLASSPVVLLILSILALILWPMLRAAEKKSSAASV